MVRVKDRYQGVSLQRPLGKAPTRFDVPTLSFQLASCTPLFKDSPSIPPFITGDDHRLGPILYPVGDPPFLLAASKANRLPRRRSTTKLSHPKPTASCRNQVDSRSDTFKTNASGEAGCDVKGEHQLRVFHLVICLVYRGMTGRHPIQLYRDCKQCKQPF